MYLTALQASKYLRISLNDFYKYKDILGIKIKYAPTYSQYGQYTLLDINKIKYILERTFRV